MRIFLLIIFVVKLVDYSYSQTVYKNGQVQIDEDSVLQGEISYFENTRKYHYILVRNSTGVNRFTPNTIKGYSFDKGKSYYSIVVEEGSIETQIFAEVVLSGMVDLLRYQSKFFARTKSQEIIWLEHNEQAIEKDGKTVLYENKKYLGVLSYLFQDCPEVQLSSQKTTYNEKSLVHIFQKYHQCQDQSYVVHKNLKNSFEFNMGVSLGLNTSSLSISSQNLSTVAITEKYDLSLSPIFGLTFRFASPRITERAEIVFDLNYFNTHYYSYNSRTVSTGEYRNDINITAHNINFPISILGNLGYD